MSEQRYRAVLAVIAEGCTVSEVAARFGVSRQTLHAWLSKYEAGGLENLGDGSHRPRSCPHQMSGEVEVLVAELRRAHPSWGPKRLVFELAKHRYRVAQTALEQVDEPVDLVRVQRVVDEASWSMARARAILDGRG